MKTYQFVGFILVGLVIAGALLVGKRKHCGCNKANQGTAIDVPVETQE